jgi:hypothetical protein
MDERTKQLTEADFRRLLLKQATAHLRVYMWELYEWNEHYLDVLEDAARDALEEIKRKVKR